MLKQAYSEGAYAAMDKFTLSQEALNEIIELTGLGALAVPTVNGLVSDPKKESEGKRKAMHGVELGGLGLLALPEARKLLAH